MFFADFTKLSVIPPKMMIMPGRAAPWQHAQNVPITMRNISRLVAKRNWTKYKNKYIHQWNSIELDSPLMKNCRGSDKNDLGIFGQI